MFIITLMSRATNDGSNDKDLQTVQDISNVNIIILIYLFIKHVLFIHMYLYKCKVHVSRVESSLVKPPPSVQSVVWRYNEFGDKLRDIENRKLCDHMKR
jgi:hypothetical protein